MISLLSLSAVDRGFEPRSGQTKDNKIDICCFSAKYTALKRKSKYWLVGNQDNVSEWGNMSIRALLFQWASTIRIKTSVLVYYKVDIILIALNINLFSPWYSWNIAELTLNNNPSLTHSSFSVLWPILSILDFIFWFLWRLFITSLNLVLLWQLFYLFCSSGRFGALKSDSTNHFFRNACTKSGSLRFSQFSGCWLILSVYILMSFDFPFVWLFGVRQFCYFRGLTIDQQLLISVAIPGSVLVVIVW
jgi:hypothetical protein